MLGGLRTQREATFVRQGDPQVLVGVHRHATDANFIVQMGSSAAAAQAYIADYIATMHRLPGDHAEAG